MLLREQYQEHSERDYLSVPQSKQKNHYGLER